MKDALIGATGFVGQNLQKQHHFSLLYNSKNISEIVGQSLDILVCAGIPANMQIANQNPEKDLEEIQKLMEYFTKIKVKNFVLISTIAVYKQPILAVKENSPMSVYEHQMAYGKNRFGAEQKVREIFPNALILRLPALFGFGLKKNLIYDLLHPLPTFFKKAAFENLQQALSSQEKEILNQYYFFEPEKQIFILKNKEKNKELLKILEKYQATSLAFTHPESLYQFYHLKNLWKDIQKALQANWTDFNLSSPALSAQKVSETLTGKNLWNRQAPLYQYDMQTQHNSTNYTYTQEEVLQELTEFYNNYAK